MSEPRKIDGADLQDMFHYALAAANRSDSAFPSEFLKERLQAGENLFNKMLNASNEEDYERYSALHGYRHNPRNENELRTFGEAALALVIKHAAEIGIDPRTGERSDIGSKLHLQSLDETEALRDFEKALDTVNQ